MSIRSIAEDVCERIVYEIAIGRHRPGDRLPSVRALAAQYKVNPSTMQIVLGRLQQGGFVESRAGLGFVVRDIDVVGGIETWKYLFRFAQLLPERAIGVLEELLETRLTLTLEALRAVAESPHEYDLSMVRRAVDQLEFAAAAAPFTPEDVARAELHASRMLLIAIRRNVLLAIFNTVSEIIVGVPAVVDAMYADPQSHVVVWIEFLNAWEEGRLRPDSVEMVHSLLSSWDASTLARFRETLDRVG